MPYSVPFSSNEMYQADDGNVRDYFPDFFVKKDEENIFIVETKGREKPNDQNKINRLVNWCNNASDSDEEGKNYNALYIKQEDWEKYKQNLKNFTDLEAMFPADQTK